MTLRPSISAIDPIVSSCSYITYHSNMPGLCIVLDCRIDTGVILSSLLIVRPSPDLLRVTIECSAVLEVGADGQFWSH